LKKKPFFYVLLTKQREMIKILQILFCVRQSTLKEKIDNIQIIESPLLQLQEYNTDVWELLMIELVKARKKKVLNEINELWNYWRSSKVDIYSQLHECVQRRLKKKRINSGRIIIKIIKGRRENPDYEEKKKEILIHAASQTSIWFPSEGRYFVYGFDLFPANNPERGQMALRYTYENKPQFILRPLEILSKLNNFEFNMNAYTPNHEIIQFLYEREKQIENDKHIYCIVQDEIIPYYYGDV
tara:strand:- start:1307 stop:2032 length:726 start_codon:yes stop_codon:yes gene_type:complete